MKTYKTTLMLSGVLFACSAGGPADENDVASSHQALRSVEGTKKEEKALLAEKAALVKELENTPPPKRPMVSAELQSALRKLPSNARILVDVFLKDPGAKDDEASASAQGEFSNGKPFNLRLNGKRATPKDFDAYHKVQQGELQSMEAQIRERFSSVAQELSRRTRVKIQTRGGRSFRAELTKKQILAVAKQSTLVRHLAIPYSPEGQDGILSALMSVGVSPDAFNLGLTGNNTGVWMNDGNGKPITTNSAIDNSDLTGQDYGTEPFENHATQTLATLMATAPDAHVHYAVPTESCNLRTDVTTFSDPPVYLSSQSNSFGDDDTTYSACSEDWDDFVYDTKIAHFALTQNEGSTIRGAGKAYNVISIGAMDDTTTPFTMAGFSNFVDPDTGADKPEVVAPGVDVDIAGWTGLNGTSFATPIAAGFAADLMESYTHTRYQPQLLKAYLMSNAVDVDGAAPFSDVDGAGRVDFARTYYNGKWRWWTGGNGSWYSSDTDGDGRLEVTFNENLVEGRTYRAVISWLVKGSYVQTNNRPNMDIDLKITSPSGTRWLSVSVSNNYELVEFTAPETGTYEVVIERYSNSGTGKVALGYHLNW